MIRELSLTDAIFVCQRMRAHDRALVRAILGDDMPDEKFAVNRWQTDGPAWTLADANGEAVAAFGLSRQNTWCATAWLLATDAMTGEMWRKLLRFCRTVRGNAFDPRNPACLNRIEAYVWTAWPEAGAFARRLGFESEGVRRRAGRGGEDFEVFALIRSEEDAHQ